MNGKTGKEENQTDGQNMEEDITHYRREAGTKQMFLDTNNMGMEEGEVKNAK